VSSKRQEQPTLREHLSWLPVLWCDPCCDV